jgi:hypothetical protein
MTDAPEFKTVRCKQCNKEFQAKMSYFARTTGPVAKLVGRYPQWCSKRHYRAYYRKVQR